MGNYIKDKLSEPFNQEAGICSSPLYFPMSSNSSWRFTSSPGYYTKVLYPRKTINLTVLLKKRIRFPQVI